MAYLNSNHILLVTLALFTGVNSKPCSTSSIQHNGACLKSIETEDLVDGINLSPKLLSEVLRNKRNSIDPIDSKDDTVGEARRVKRYTHREVGSGGKKGLIGKGHDHVKVKQAKSRQAGVSSSAKRSNKSTSNKFGEKDILELLQRDIDQELADEMKASGVNDTRMLRNMTEATSEVNASTVQNTETTAENVETTTAGHVETAAEHVETTAGEIIAITTTTEGAATLCEMCSEVENMIIEEKKEELRGSSSLIVEPAFSCDQWHIKARTCLYNRNLGDTITFVLAFKHLEGQIPRVVWRQEFHVQNSNARKDAIMDPDFPVWNVVIGSEGRELRVSPITEVDIDFNRFSATVHTDDVRTNEIEGGSPLNKVTFQIRTLPVDLGFVYPGEAITLNIASFVSLPQESMSYKWFLERDGESGTLPSNMKTSASGGSMAISELRKEQEGVLTCSVYTNKGIFATKKRFLIKELFDDVLMSMNAHNSSSLERRSSRMKVLKRHARHAISTNDFYRETSNENTNEQERETSQDDTRFENSEIGAADNFASNPLRHHQNSAIENIESGNEPMMNQMELNEPERQDENIAMGLNHVTDYPSESQEINGDRMPAMGSYEENGLLSPAGQSEIANDVENPDLLSQTHLQNKYLDEAGFAGIPSDHVARNGMQGLPHPKNNLHKIETHPPHHNYPLEPENRIHVVENNHGERDVTLQFFKGTSNKEVKAEDRISRLMSYCQRDRQCSGFAVCIRNDIKSNGFCRCLPGFHGNGLFCWEDVNVRNVVVGENSDEARTEPNVPQHNRHHVKGFHGDLRKRRIAKHIIKKSKRSKQRHL